MNRREPRLDKASSITAMASAILCLAILAGCPSSTSPGTLGSGDDSGIPITVYLYRTLDGISNLAFDGKPVAFGDNSASIQTTEGRHTISWRYSVHGSNSDITKTMSLSASYPHILVGDTDASGRAAAPVVSAISLDLGLTRVALGATLRLSADCESQYGTPLSAGLVYTVDGVDIAGDTLVLSEAKDYLIGARAGTIRAEPQSVEAVAIESLRLVADKTCVDISSSASVGFRVEAKDSQGQMLAIGEGAATIQKDGLPFAGMSFAPTAAGSSVFVANANGIESAAVKVYAVSLPAWTASRSIAAGLEGQVRSIARSVDGRYLAFEEYIPNGSNSSSCALWLYNTATKALTHRSFLNGSISLMRFGADRLEMECGSQKYSLSLPELTDLTSPQYLADPGAVSRDPVSGKTARLIEDDFSDYSKVEIADDAGTLQKTVTGISETATAAWLYDGKLFVVDPGHFSTITITKIDYSGAAPVSSVLQAGGAAGEFSQATINADGKSATCVSLDHNTA
jgi:hypothetical protein